MTDAAEPIRDRMNRIRMVFSGDDDASIEAYRKVLEPMFAFAIPESAREAAFNAEADAYSLPDVLVTRTLGTAMVLVRSHETIARSAVDQFLIVVYQSGGCRFEIDGEKHWLEKGWFAFFDLSQPLKIEADAVDNVGLLVSRRRLEALAPFVEEAHGLVLEPGAIAHILETIIHEILTVGMSMPVGELGAIADTIIRLVASAIETRGNRRKTDSIRRNAPLAAIKASIERQLADPELGPQKLAEEFATTRSTLYRLFEPLGGVTSYVNERRLRAAFRLLTDPREPRRRIAEIAFRFGFVHPSAFARAFKERFGMSPSQVQSRHAGRGADDSLFAVLPDSPKYYLPEED